MTTTDHIDDLDAKLPIFMANNGGIYKIEVDEPTFRLLCWQSHAQEWRTAFSGNARVAAIVVAALSDFAEAGEGQ